MKALNAVRVSKSPYKLIASARALPLALGAVGSFLVVPMALAQSANPSGSNDASQTQQVQEVVVTAQRRTENIQNVPITITALTARDLT